MPEHELWITALVNKFFGGITTLMLDKLAQAPHLAWVRPADPLHPIPNYVAGEILVLVIILVGAVVLRMRLSVENPGKFQHCMEYFLEFTRDMADEMIGHSGRRYVAMIGTLGIFILICNVLGLIPTLETPTANIQVTLGCAVVAFVYYNFHGFREKGIIGYLRHLCGPMLAIAILMFPIEVFSNFFRMLSLSVRLWANMLVGGMLETVFTSLIPIAVPCLFMALHIFESFLQAYVFMILPAVYISMAVAEEH